MIRTLSRAYASEDMFARFAASGLAILFGVQAAINMAVNLQLIPAKGMTLPFISYGGSSIDLAGLWRRHDAGADAAAPAHRGRIDERRQRGAQLRLSYRLRHCEVRCANRSPCGTGLLRLRSHDGRLFEAMDNYASHSAGRRRHRRPSVSRRSARRRADQARPARAARHRRPRAALQRPVHQGQYRRGAERDRARPQSAVAGAHRRHARLRHAGGRSVWCGG